MDRLVLPTGVLTGTSPATSSSCTTRSQLDSTLYASQTPSNKKYFEGSHQAMSPSKTVMNEDPELPVSRFMNPNAYAMFLGLNLKQSRKDQTLFQILKPVLNSQLPKPWSARNDMRQDRVYFWDSALLEASYRHPLERFFIDLMRMLKENLFLDDGKESVKKCLLEEIENCGKINGEELFGKWEQKKIEGKEGFFYVEVLQQTALNSTDSSTKFHLRTRFDNVEMTIAANIRLRLKLLQQVWLAVFSPIQVENAFPFDNEEDMDEESIKRARECVVYIPEPVVIQQKVGGPPTTQQVNLVDGTVGEQSGDFQAGEIRDLLEKEAGDKPSDLPESQRPSTQVTPATDKMETPTDQDQVLLVGLRALDNAIESYVESQPHPGDLPVEVPEVSVEEVVKSELPKSLMLDGSTAGGSAAAAGPGASESKKPDFLADFAKWRLESREKYRTAKYEGRGVVLVREDKSKTAPSSIDVTSLALQFQQSGAADTLTAPIEAWVDAEDFKQFCEEQTNDVQGQLTTLKEAKESSEERRKERKRLVKERIEKHKSAILELRLQEKKSKMKIEELGKMQVSKLEARLTEELAAVVGGDANVKPVAKKAKSSPDDGDEGAAQQDEEPKEQDAEEETKQLLDHAVIEVKLDAEEMEVEKSAWEIQQLENAESDPEAVVEKAKTISEMNKKEKKSAISSFFSQENLGEDHDPAATAEQMADAEAANPAAGDGDANGAEAGGPADAAAAAAQGEAIEAEEDHAAEDEKPLDTDEEYRQEQEKLLSSLMSDAKREEEAKLAAEEAKAAEQKRLEAEKNSHFYESELQKHADHVEEERHRLEAEEKALRGEGDDQTSAQQLFMKHGIYDSDSGASQSSDYYGKLNQTQKDTGLPEKPIKNKRFIPKPSWDVFPQLKNLIPERDSLDSVVEKVHTTDPTVLSYTEKLNEISAVWNKHLKAERDVNDVVPEDAKEHWKKLIYPSHKPQVTGPGAVEDSASAVLPDMKQIEFFSEEIDREILDWPEVTRENRAAIVQFGLFGEDLPTADRCFGDEAANIPLQGCAGRCPSPRGEEEKEDGGADAAVAVGKDGKPVDDLEAANSPITKQKTAPASSLAAQEKAKQLAAEVEAAALKKAEAEEEAGRNSLPHDVHRQFLPPYVAKIHEEIKQERILADQLGLPPPKKPKKQRPRSADGRFQTESMFMDSENSCYCYSKEVEEENKILKDSLKTRIAMHKMKYDPKAELIDLADDELQNELDDARLYLEKQMKVINRKKSGSFATASEEQEKLLEQALGAAEEKKEEKPKWEKMPQIKRYKKTLEILDALPQDAAVAGFVPTDLKAMLVPAPGMTDDQATSYVRAVHKLERAGMLNRYGEKSGKTVPKHILEEEEAENELLNNGDYEFVPDGDCENAVSYLSDFQKLYIKRLANAVYRKNQFHSTMDFDSKKLFQFHDLAKTGLPISTELSSLQDLSAANANKSANVNKSRHLNVIKPIQSARGNLYPLSQLVKELKPNYTLSTWCRAVEKAGFLERTRKSGNSEGGSNAGFIIKHLKMACGGLANAFFSLNQSTLGSRDIVCNSMVIPKTRFQMNWTPLMHGRIDVDSDLAFEKIATPGNQFITPIDLCGRQLGQQIMRFISTRLRWALNKPCLSFDKDFKLRDKKTGEIELKPLTTVELEKRGERKTELDLIKIDPLLVRPLNDEEVAELQLQQDTLQAKNERKLALQKEEQEKGQPIEHQKTLEELSLKLAQVPKVNKFQVPNDELQEPRSELSAEDQLIEELIMDVIDEFENEMAETPGMTSNSSPFAVAADGDHAATGNPQENDGNKSEESEQPTVLLSQDQIELQFLYKRSREVKKNNKPEMLEKIGTDFQLATSWNASNLIDQAVDGLAKNVVKQALTLFANYAVAELYPTNVPKIPTLSTFRMLVNARTRETRDHLMERKRESLKERGEDFAKLQQMLQDVDAEMLDEESVVSLAEEVERMYEKILTKRGINPKKKPLKDEFADDPFFHILPPVMRAIADTTVYRTYSKVFREIGCKPKDYNARKKEMEERKKAYLEAKKENKTNTGSMSRTFSSTDKLTMNSQQLSNSFDFSQTSNSFNTANSVQHNRSTSSSVGGGVSTLSSKVDKGTRSTYSMWNAGVDLKTNSTSFGGKKSLKTRPMANTFSGAGGAGSVQSGGHGRGLNNTFDGDFRSVQLGEEGSVLSPGTSTWLNNSTNMNDSFLSNSPSWFQSQESEFQNTLRKLQSKKVKNTLVAVSEQHRQEKQFLNEMILGVGEEQRASSPQGLGARKFERFR